MYDNDTEQAGDEPNENRSSETPRCARDVLGNVVRGPFDDSSFPNRRSVLGATAAGLVAGLAGCPTGLSGGREYEAAPVRLTDEAVGRGYEFRETARPELTESVDIGDSTTEVTIRSYVASYDHEPDAAVALVSTPLVEEAGQSLNPVATSPIRDLLTGEAGRPFTSQLGVESAFVRGPEAVGGGTGTLLDQSVEFTTFAGVTGDDAFVLLHAARVERDGDAVLVGSAWTSPVELADSSFVGPDGYVNEEFVDENATDFADLLPFVDHGGAPPESGSSRAGTAQALIDDPEDDATWTTLSGRIVQARHDGDPTSVNEELREAAETVSTPGLDMVFEFWAAENLVKAGRFEDAIDRFRELLAEYDEMVFLDMEFRATVLRKLATAQEEADRIDDALSTYDELADETGGTEARPYYRKGLAAERAGMDRVAIRAYENAADADDPNPHHLSGLDEMGRRSALRVADPFPGFHETAEELAERLAAVVREEALDELASLASPTHFAVGPAGGCQEFVAADLIVEHLAADAEESDVSADEEDVTEAGKSVYLHTDRWRGDLFEGAVDFVLTERPQGWEWAGLAIRDIRTIERLLARWRENWDPELFSDPPYRSIPDVPRRTETSTPTPTETRTETATPTATPTPTPSTSNYPSIDIAAPFDDSQRFRAGGLPNPVGAGGGCGAGVPGYYYDHGPTHRASRGAKHAIDFTQYRGLLGTNSAFGKDVLATSHGVVHEVVEKYANGSNNGANKVAITHYAKNRCDVYTDYRSRYLHLAGKYLVAASKGAHFTKGTVFGMMDNSGTSVLHHLHFNVRNLHTNESVRPSPMDNQYLTPQDNGRCVKSNNARTVSLVTYENSEPSCE